MTPEDCLMILLVLRQSRKVYFESLSRSFFPVNVPFNLPTPVEWPCPDEPCFRMLDGDVIVFKPREWRGTSTVSSDSCMSWCNKPNSFQKFAYDEQYHLLPARHSPIFLFPILCYSATSCW